MSRITTCLRSVLSDTTISRSIEWFTGFGPNLMRPLVLSIKVNGIPYGWSCSRTDLWPRLMASLFWMPETGNLERGDSDCGVLVPALPTSTILILKK